MAIHPDSVAVGSSSATTMDNQGTQQGGRDKVPNKIELDATEKERVDKEINRLCDSFKEEQKPILRIKLENFFKSSYVGNELNDRRLFEELWSEWVTYCYAQLKMISITVQLNTEFHDTYDVDKIMSFILPFDVHSKLTLSSVFKCKKLLVLDSIGQIVDKKGRPLQITYPIAKAHLERQGILLFARNVNDRTYDDLGGPCQIKKEITARFIDTVLPNFLKGNYYPLKKEWGFSKFQQLKNDSSKLIKYFDKYDVSAVSVCVVINVAGVDEKKSTVTVSLEDVAATATVVTTRTTVGIASSPPKKKQSRQLQGKHVFLQDLPEQDQLPPKKNMKYSANPPCLNNLDNADVKDNEKRERQGADDELPQKKKRKKNSLKPRQNKGKESEKGKLECQDSDDELPPKKKRKKNSLKPRQNKGKEREKGKLECQDSDDELPLKKKRKQTSEKQQSSTMTEPRQNADTVPLKTKTVQTAKEQTSAGKIESRENLMKVNDAVQQPTKKEQETNDADEEKKDKKQLGATPIPPVMTFPLETWV